MKKKIWIESFFCTIMVFIFAGLCFYLFTKSLKPLNYFAGTLKSINLSDIYFSHLKDSVVDTGIVIINAGQLDRAEIAALIDSLSVYKPKVIGLDVLFSNKSEDISGLKVLEKTLIKHKEKIVMASFVDQKINRLSDDYIYFKEMKYGHVNMISNKERTESVRHFNPTLKISNDRINSFSSEICRLTSPERYEELRRSDNEKMLINYSGNKYTFENISGDSILYKNKNIRSIKNKIVLIGFLGAGELTALDDLSDMFYTPMNPTFIGRSHPDMYGVVIHANILKMIQEDNYLLKVYAFIGYFFTAMILYLHIVLFMFIFLKTHIWYHLTSKLIQLISIALIVGFVFFFIDKFNLLFDFKLLFICIFLAVDLIYVYELLANLSHKYFGWKSVFIKNH